MSLLDYLIPFVVALGLLILVHEMGHYLVARLCGVKVLRFSIGFGKPLLSRRLGRDGTEWALGAFPLGGYVKMVDEREGEVAPDELHRAFNRQSVGRRFAIVAAGPLANLLLAVFVYWGLFVAGAEELRPRLALTAAEQSAAVGAGVRDGDLVTAINGEAVRSWQDLRWALLRHTLDGQQAVLQVRTLDEAEAVRTLDLSGIGIDEGGVDPVERIGLRPWRPRIPAVVSALVPGGAAARAGLQAGDTVAAIDGSAIGSGIDLVERVSAAAGRRLDVEVLRNGEALHFTLTPQEETESGHRIGRIGIQLASPSAQDMALMFATVRYGVGEGLAKAMRQTWESSAMSLKMIGRMITGDLSWKNLSGPLTIADYAGQTARLGWDHYLKFIAIISISLGVLNLLPIPVLDGGHLLYYVAEIIKGGPIPERVMEIGQQIGLVLLAMLMAFAFYNDITRFISG